MVEPVSPSSIPTSEQILSALSRTGFIFEYRVAQRLRELGLSATLNHAFIDSESGKSREIDVVADAYANVEQGDDATKIIVNASLLIECKNYSDPLIVIGRENDVFFHNDEPLISFDPLAYSFPGPRAANLLGIRYAMRLHDAPSHASTGFIGSQLIRMDRNKGEWRASNDSIYDSIVQPLVKARDHERAVQMAQAELYPEDPPWYLPTFVYTMPVLVTAGSVFAVDVVPNGEPVINKANWVPLVRHYSDGSVLMHIVSFDGIDRYLEERVFPLINESRQKISENLHFFDPEWLVRQYGESPHPEFLQWLSQARSAE